MIFEVNPPPTPQGEGFLGGKGTIFWGRCVVTTYLELLSSNLVLESHLGANSKSPLTPLGRGLLGGGPLGDGALCFRGKGVVVTFLKLLSSNLVCKPYLGGDSNF